MVVAMGAGLVAGCGGKVKEDSDDEDSSSNDGGSGGGSNEEQSNPDSDGDGVPDSQDDFPNDSQYSEDSDGDGVADPEDDFPNDSQYSRELESKSETIEVNEDDYQYYKFEFGQPTTLKYDFIVRDGPEIDAILVSDSEFDQFQGGNRYEYSTTGSALDTGGDEVEVDLSAGEYVLIFDNTSAGEAAPPTNFDDDVAEIELELEAFQ